VSDKKSLSARRYRQHPYIHAYTHAKGPHIRAKESYIRAKEPYICAKDNYIHANKVLVCKKI